MMSRREKILYHQIQPLKLAVDVATSVLSTWMSWQHLAWWLWLLVAFLPSIVVTAGMVRFMDFSSERDSTFGRYVAFHMTRVAETVRMGGQILMWAAAFYHSAWGIALGAVVVIFGWTYSLPRWRAR